MQRYLFNFTPEGPFKNVRRELACRGTCVTCFYIRRFTVQLSNSNGTLVAALQLELCNLDVSFPSTAAAAAAAGRKNNVHWLQSVGFALPYFFLTPTTPFLPRSDRPPFPRPKITRLNQKTERPVPLWWG